MALDENYKNFVLDQLEGLRDFESKKMFGGLALLIDGSAFAKIKHDTFWLKVDDTNRKAFEDQQMQQYTYGKDNSRKLNFYECPIEVLENKDKLIDWVNQSIKIALDNKK